MKKINLAFLFLVALSSCKTSKAPVSLFSGTSFKGWHIDVPAMDTDKDARNPFIIRNGNLVSLGTPGGHLITDASFSNYRIELEYRFVGEPGNCGALVHASKPRRLYAMFPQSVEVQMKHKNAGDFWCIGENIEVPNMEKRRGPKENWGVDGKKARRIKNLTGDMENELGEWNFMTIECLEDQVKVWLNGNMVNHGFNATATSGSFALQSEGSEVEFRKVMHQSIKKLSKN